MTTTEETTRAARDYPPLPPTMGPHPPPTWLHIRIRWLHVRPTLTDGRHAPLLDNRVWDNLLLDGRLGGDLKKKGGARKEKEWTHTHSRVL